ncbi:InlB B-repeat-containing protein [Lactonifactor sp. BIOML-A6]|uniref:InlB B-repeat-containing protein n=1 Tax=Lactonifactor sp. BIOML-A6 TaxID=2584659 RepID=UPI0012B04FE8|nr:InlB B-repeat-containing protein [Lactonifactor sp. BIOML-A6]MSB12089.1 hypothetical protein [Lactonifactor sp. BIOML-A6]
MREKKRGVYKRIISIVLAVVMIVSSCVINPRTISAAAWDPREDYKDLKLRFWEDEEPGIRFYMNAGLRYILETVTEPSVGSTYGEWSVMDLLRAKYTGMDYLNYVDANYFTDYIYRMEQYVDEKISSIGRLDRSKCTEYSRLILAMSAMGYDITSVGYVSERENKYDFIDELSKSYAYSHKQGINGPIWEIIALNTGTAQTGKYYLYSKPSGGDPKDYNTTGKMIDYILNDEIIQSNGTRGGWALYNNYPDVDITGMALQALAPYYNNKDLYDETGAEKNYEQMREAVERGVYILSQLQEENGGFDSWGSINAESIAQVIVALTSLNIDPKAENVNLTSIGKNCSFITKGAAVDGVYSNNMIDALLAFWAAGTGSSPEVGGFKHVTFGYDGGGGSGTKVNAMATDQAVYALTAYDRYLAGETSLYDMGDSTENNYLWNDAKNYKVTFDGNSYTDTFNKEQSPYSVIELPTTPVNGEMELVGWNTEPDGTGTSYMPNELLSMPEKDITLYAQYGKPEYMIQWELNGGILDDSIELPSVYRPSTDSFTLPTAEDISRRGYTFEGWYDNKALKGSPVVQIEKGSYGDKNFYAKWLTDWTPITKFYGLVNKWDVITLADKKSIEDARGLYEGMEQNQKDEVGNIAYNKLLNAEAELARLEELQQGVDIVIELIREIESPITLDMESTIINARNEYIKLPKEARDLVNNYQVLVQAERELAALKDAHQAADEVIGLIQAIGGVDLESKAAIETARAAYNALSTEQRNLINSETYQILVDAEEELSALETAQENVDNIVSAINALGEITEDSKEAVVEVREAYEALSYLQKKEISNYDILLEAEAQLRELEAGRQKVQNVKDMIASLENVGVDSWEQAGQAKASYLLLDETQTEKITQEEIDYLNEVLNRIKDQAEEQQGDNDWAAANEIMGMITAIGPVSLDREALIIQTRSALLSEDLTVTAKAMVENYYSLVMAETQLNEIKKSKEAAETVSALILAIGTVTADSQEAIEKARYAYDALSAEEKAFVPAEDVTLLSDSEALYFEILNQIENEGDLKAAQSVIDAIEAIGEVELSKASQIEAVRQQYLSLSGKQKKMVTNYSKLMEAEQQIADLKASQSKVENVIKMIQNIGEVTQDSKDAVYEARAEYDRLTDQEKVLVGQENSELLFQKEKELEEILSQYVAITNTITLIDNIGTVDLDKVIYINSARKAYDALTEEQKKEVTNYDVLLKAEAELTRIYEAKRPVDSLVSQINELWSYIGQNAENITLSNRSQIESIMTSINGLSEEQKRWMNNETVAMTRFSEMQKKLEELKAALLPSKVSLDRTQITLNKNSSTSLKATVLPSTAENKNVKWKSSNSLVASVDGNGRVTAVSQGTAVITVTTAAEGKTATCKVTVSYSGKWIKDGKGWWYRYSDGNYPKSGWSLVSGQYYYFDVNGYMKTGWLYTSGKWYYLGSDGAMKTGWQKVGASWYYMSDSGAMVTGWLKLGNTWYYLNGSGAMLTNWQKIGGKWYYFNGSGAMLTNWQKIGGKWYYLNGSGAMLTGWQFIGGKWYYLNGSGAMLTNWQKIGGSWYYMDGSGVMLTNWQRLGGTWYYFNGSGAMLTGWQFIGGKWYYMNGSGAMLTGWQKIGGSWYYFNGSGAMASNTWVGNSYVNGSGVWAKSR